jgi:hypothetical protein
LTLFNELFTPYSFKGLIDLVIGKIGYASLIVLFGAYLGLIVYYCTIPSKGRYSTDYARTNAMNFLMQIFYAPLVITLMLPFISGWWSFFTVWFFYGIIGVPLFFIFISFRQDFVYKDYYKLRLNVLSMWSKYVIVGFSLVAVLVEIFVFSFLNPTIPTVGWVVILYVLATGFVMSAFAQSVLYNARTCVYGKITTTDGATIEGFIVAKGEDNYLVSSKDGELLVSCNCVKTISPTELPRAK